eukprot:3271771-Ditylum_brightwellii.AAC.1
MGAAGLKGWAILFLDSNRSSKAEHICLTMALSVFCRPGTSVDVNNTGPAALGGCVVGQTCVGLVGLGRDVQVGRRYGQLLVGSALVLRLMQDVRAFHLP